jgi:hypothetical protein
MEVPSESFSRSSWDSRTCYPWRATNQGLTDDWLAQKITEMFLNPSGVIGFLPEITVRQHFNYKKELACDLGGNLLHQIAFRGVLDPFLWIHH